MGQIFSISEKMDKINTTNSKTWRDGHNFPNGIADSFMVIRVMRWNAIRVC